MILINKFGSMEGVCNIRFHMSFPPFFFILFSHYFYLSFSVIGGIIPWRFPPSVPPQSCFRLVGHTWLVSRPTSMHCTLGRFSCILCSLIERGWQHNRLLIASQGSMELVSILCEGN